MSNLLQLQNGAKSFGSREIFAAASFSVNLGEHVGVIGPNGAGKTTLFKILVGHENLDEGEVIRSQELRLGYLAQHDLWKPDESVEDYLLRKDPSQLSLELPIWELKQLGKGLGLSQEQFQKPVTDLSGGYRMRVKLLRLLGSRPNLMLLDEPTNYLDLETMLVLEDFLRDYSGAFMLISHDREFLRRTTDHILEVEAGETTKYPGSIDDYFEQKTLLRSQLEARALSAEAKRKVVLDFAARFGAKASKARQVQSRLKSLDRMEQVEVKDLPIQARINIPAPKRVGKLVLEAKELSAGYRLENGQERKILGGLHFQLHGGDRIGVVGLNGAGKSTLLKTLSGNIPPLAGEIERGFEMSFAAYGQHVAEGLENHLSVFESLVSVTDVSTSHQEVLNLAGSLLFSGDDVRKKVSVLSGGEKSRVALGQILLKRASCLLLDEPTNHLDFYTVEALTQALQTFPGTVIVVSHDRSFIGRVATKILEVKEGVVRLYPGSYEDYLWSLAKGALKKSADSPANATTRVSANASLKSSSATNTGRPGNTSSQAGPPSAPALSMNTSSTVRVKRGELEKTKRALEKDIERLQRKIDEQNKAIALKSSELEKSSGPALKEFSIEIAHLQADLQDFESVWLEKATEIENIEKLLKSLF